MKKLLILFGVIFLLGCVAPLAVIQVEPQYYQSEYNQIWNATVDTLDEMGYTPVQMQRDEGFITTEKRIFFRPMYGVALQATSLKNALIISNAGLPGDTRERIKITVRLSKEEAQTRVKVTPHIEHNRPLWGEVESNGHLEKAIQDSIASKLK